MDAQKPLILPWLVEKLDAQEYPGVSWLNPERTRFRVPWKHGSRQNAGPEDFQIFEDWAVARGRYRSGIDQRSPSEWKRNFRAALNRKEGIEMVQDNSTDAEDPHKVFEMHSTISNPNGAVARPVNADSDNPSPMSVGSVGPFAGRLSSSQNDTLESVLSTLDLSSSQEDAVWVGGLTSTNLDLNLTLPATTGTSLEPVLETNMYVLGEQNPVFCGDQPPPSLNLVAGTVPPLDQILGSTTFETDFEVRIYYRGRLVFTNLYSNTRGLCFVPPGSSGGYHNLSDVVFPDPLALNSQLQASYTQRLLQAVAPGVLLRIEGKLLCGRRRGHCHVFWSQSEIATERTLCGELPKEHLCPIYSLHQFMEELIGYLEGRNHSPKYTLWLCFGEDWPDAKHPWKKKLIMVEVVPKVFEVLYELSQASGASSLKECNPDLRISDSLQQHSFLDQLREWKEKMEVESSN
ncbi:hypothetical protein JRQ81_005387 [Phrynocephalus forsythii]|uniref:IRF tryptophan pentad repeat domain-containing protein n=1 Tax=Phrynocephalus forsythii TaxID=171643 RepID=A0A9Q1AVU4_9SAUR|nr:hypothetical protein JRQ81_005387 [Phrynocephalus forsythii]